MVARRAGVALGSEASQSEFPSGLPAAREYSAFGEIIPGSSSGTWPGRFGYQGQGWLEVNSGDGSQRLLLPFVRVYDPSQGRFLQNEYLVYRRPLVHYRYAVGSPIDLVDPFGQQEAGYSLPGEVFGTNAQRVAAETYRQGVLELEARLGPDYGNEGGGNNFRRKGIEDLAKGVMAKGVAALVDEYLERADRLDGDISENIFCKSAQVMRLRVPKREEKPPTSGVSLEVGVVNVGLKATLYEDSPKGKAKLEAKIGAGFDDPVWFYSGKPFEAKVNASLRLEAGPFYLGAQVSQNLGGVHAPRRKAVVELGTGLLFKF